MTSIQLTRRGSLRSSYFVPLAASQHLSVLLEVIKLLKELSKARFASCEEPLEVEAVAPIKTER